VNKSVIRIKIILTSTLVYIAEKNKTYNKSRLNRILLGMKCNIIKEAIAKLGSIVLIKRQ
jgi:hypothetical protein